MITHIHADRSISLAEARDQVGFVVGALVTVDDEVLKMLVR